MTSIPLTQDEVFELLKKKNLNPIIQKETGQTYITWKIHNQDVHVFFVIYGDNHLLQSLAYVPITFKETTRNDVARLLHLLNKEVDLPGFGMDENEKLIFYRLVFPCLEKRLDLKLFDNYLEATKLALETFMGAIGMIATGSAKLDPLMEQYKKEKKHSSHGS